MTKTYKINTFRSTAAVYLAKEFGIKFANTKLKSIDKSQTLINMNPFMGLFGAKKVKGEYVFTSRKAADQAASRITSLASHGFGEIKKANTVFVRVDAI